MSGTAIATWGNSEAIRIPQGILRQVGLRKGDRVSFRVTPESTIEIVPEMGGHRRVQAERGVTFDSLFSGYEPAGAIPPAWPSDEMVGAEGEAWS